MGATVAVIVAAVALQVGGNLSDFITLESRKELEASIHQTESKTTGEVVVCIAKKSGRYERSEDLIIVLFSSVFLIITWLFFQRLESDTWGELTMNIGLFEVISIVLISIGFTLTLTRFIFPRLVLIFTSMEIRYFNVQTQASMQFLLHKTNHTEAETGVMIYVSILERIVSIIGDDAISDKITESQWSEARDVIITKIKQDNLVSGVKQGIEKVGALLEEHFPAKPGDKDEVSNKVIIFNGP